MVAFRKKIGIVLGALSLIVFAGEAAALTCTSKNDGDWKDSIWSSNTNQNTNACNANDGPPAGSTVVIAQGTTVKADVKNNTAIVGDITINGTLKGKGGDTLKFSGNLTLGTTGAFTAKGGTVELTGTNQTITGNMTFNNLTVGAGTQLTLAGNIIITGTTNLATSNIVSTCPTNYTITNQTSGAVQNTCTTGGTGGGTGTGATCTSLLPTMPVGGQAVASGGTTNIGTGTNVNGTAVTVTAGNNTILNPATTTSWNSASAALPTPPSPIPTSKVITTVSTAGLAAGSYGDVRVTTGVRAFTGGSYFINELYVAPGATAQLAPGDYYVNKLTVGNKASTAGGSITLSGNGLVRIFVTTNAKGDATLAGVGSSGIWDGSSVNQGGDPANLQILLYPNVTYLEIGNNTQLTGFVVQPVYTGAAGAKAIDVHQGTTITGGVYTAGLLNIKQNVTFNYNAQVASALTAMSSCTGVHHFEVQHTSGSGVTCTPSTLTIVACADGNTSCTPYTKGVSGIVSATGTPTVNWVGGTGFTIPAGSSSVTKDVQITTAGSVVIGASGTPATTAATSCNFGTPACTFTSASAGFIVSAPDHAADTTSTLTIKAVQAAPTNPLVCAPGMTGAKTVNLKCTYSNPVSGTLAVRVGGTALNATNAATSACDTGGANVSLTFDKTGVATPTLQYADAGKMSISAGFTGTTGTVDAGLTMSGAGTFIAAPASFSISNVTTGSIKAGNNFSATVSALNASGNVTKNFGKENLHLTAPNNIPEGVTLSSTLVGPTGGDNPALANGSVGGALFTGGVATVSTLNWREVGDVKLNAALINAGYLGSTQAPVGTTTAATSFIPDHFDTQIVQTGVGTAIVPMACPAELVCPANVNGASGMVYSGQPFAVQVFARNTIGCTMPPAGTFDPATDPCVTKNYQGTTYAQTVALSEASSGNALANNTLSNVNFVLGVGKTSAASLPSYSIGASAPTDIAIRATAAVGATTVSSSGFAEGGLKVAQGRIKISNAYGGEHLPLSLTGTVEYCSAVVGGNCVWTMNGRDNSSSFDTAANIVAAIVKGPLTAADIAVSGGVLTVSGGTVVLNIAAPNKSGVANIGLNAPTYLPTLNGQATFGVYKGNREFIYQREAY